jgi:hypothetical protein
VHLDEKEHVDVAGVGAAVAVGDSGQGVVAADLLAQVVAAAGLVGEPRDLADDGGAGVEGDGEVGGGGLARRAR